jgi:hypothetical protein
MPRLRSYPNSSTAFEDTDVGVHDDAMAVLKLFNEHVEELENSTFTSFVRERGVSFNMSAHVGEETKFEVVGPTQESTKAFVLTLRMFLQKKDRISIEKLSAAIAALPISKSLNDRFTEFSAAWNSAMGVVLVELDGTPITQRYLIDVFLYGVLAHLDADKRDAYNEWQKDPLISEMLRSYFNSAIVATLNFLRWARLYNEEVLKTLVA